MSYEFLSSFAQTWGLLYFVLMFAAAVAYALWPSNKKEFQRAAHMPLIDEEPINE
ncbi:MAG: CcoQ/FixQ family Cbb3-type cytochrome c oxidase assembly chaperone [Ponticaulis sp.]|nr:CcoQ/FixQ family Cbb3-type cytochrome c oxidase assembly chaperone [Ponticaulis sp.]|tara:strand:+ start:25467 stop:25631 length:165 start_codon:yes stop_codon:yes gene_type:complete